MLGGREGGARNSLPVLERKSRIAEYNRRPISREGEREREESEERAREDARLGAQTSLLARRKSGGIL